MNSLYWFSIGRNWDNPMGSPLIVTSSLVQITIESTSELEGQEGLTREKLDKV